jgi:hypothetical protein
MVIQVRGIRQIQMQNIKALIKWYRANGWYERAERLEERMK